MIHKLVNERKVRKNENDTRTGGYEKKKKKRE